MSGNKERNIKLMHTLPSIYNLVSLIFEYPGGHITAEGVSSREESINNFINFILSGDEAINTIAEIRYQIKNMESGPISILGDSGL